MPAPDVPLRLSKEPPLATVLIDRAAKRNALTQSMWAALPELMADVAADTSIAAVVLRGPAGGPFSAGADISEFESLRSGENARRYGEIVYAGVEAVASLPKATIALIQGSCIGGGCELALACDLRVTDTSARLGITPAKLGLVYSLPSTARLVDTVGPATAKFILFTGDLVDAPTALRTGLINEMLTPEAVEARAYELAAHVAQRAQVSVRAAKRIVAVVAAGRRDVDDEVHALYEESYESPEYAEGVRAFLEKRAPDFAAARRQA